VKDGTPDSPYSAFERRFSYQEDLDQCLPNSSRLNTTIIMIDFAVGFANVIRSHNLTVFQSNVLLLAKTALAYKSGFVVTNGPNRKASGPLYLSSSRS